MKPWLAFTFLLAGGSLVAGEVPEGFIEIFDGKTLEDWEGSDQYWSVEDGCLTGVVDGSLKMNRFIVWKGGTVRNFEWRGKVKVTKGGNSGFQYRSVERPDLGEWVVQGYQADVLPARPEMNGMFYEERGRRIMGYTGTKVLMETKGRSWIVGELPMKEFPAGMWHEYRILVQGNKHEHWIDGHKTVEAIDLDKEGRRLEGILAFQVHVGPAMKVQYKDLWLKHLPDDFPLIEKEIPGDALLVRPQGTPLKGWTPVKYSQQEKKK